MRLMSVLAALVAICIAANARATVPWDNPDGSAVNFDWANGQNSDTNYFGSPNWFGGDDLYFLSSDFSAFADDSDAFDEATDTFDVDLIAHPGQKLLRVDVFEFGDYNITGSLGNSVSADLDMVGSVLGHPMSPFTGGFLVEAAGPTTGAIPWDDTAMLLMSFAVPDVTELHLTVTNSLVAISDGSGGTASIEGNFVQLGVSITVIPEPATLVLLAAGGLLLVRRRR